MINQFLNKLGLGKKDAPAVASDSHEMRFDLAADAPRGVAKIKSLLPDELKVGVSMRALPEQLPIPPRAWNVVVQRVELESFWVQRIPSESDPLPVAKGETLTLVTFDEHHQRTYECPILKIKSGNPEQLQLAPPAKFQKETSKIAGSSARKHYRAEVRIPAEVRISQHTAPISCHTRDISLGGISIEANRTLEEGLELELRIMSWSFPLNCRVKVVRSFEMDGVHVMALGFPPDLSTISKDLVGNFIVEHQRGH